MTRPAAPLTRTHRRYVLRAGTLAGRPTARAFLDGAPGQRGIVAETTGPTPEAALDALAALLDQRRADWHAASRLDAPTGARVLPPAAYAEALAAVRMSPAQAKMLAAHYNAGGRGLTASELTAVAGHEGYEFANAHYGALGTAVARWLDLPLVSAIDPRMKVATAAIATVVPARKSGEFVWAMHPEVAAALDA
jgi:hypothetical protein